MLVIIEGQKIKYTEKKIKERLIKRTEEGAEAL